MDLALWKVLFDMQGKWAQKNDGLRSSLTNWLDDDYVFIDNHKDKLNLL